MTTTVEKEIRKFGEVIWHFEKKKGKEKKGKGKKGKCPCKTQLLKNCPCGWIKLRRNPPHVSLPWIKFGGKSFQFILSIQTHDFQAGLTFVCFLTHYARILMSTFTLTYLYDIKQWISI